MGAYAEDCYFADPFAGFKGTERFVKNVRNLGGMLCVSLHTRCRGSTRMALHLYLRAAHVVASQMPGLRAVASGLEQVAAHKHTRYFSDLNV
jgi:hypothetical protein